MSTISRGRPTVYAKQQKYFAALEAIPYFEIRYGRLVRRGTSIIQKGVDVRLAVDMVMGAAKDHYDTAVIVTGDGDLSEAVVAVKDFGKHVEVASFLEAQADALRRVADCVIRLDRLFLQTCLLPPATPPP